MKDATKFVVGESETMPDWLWDLVTQNKVILHGPDWGAITHICILDGDHITCLAKGDTLAMMGSDQLVFVKALRPHFLLQPNPSGTIGRKQC